MYGGGFATVPAYLADIFGTKMVGAIHGRLLTAWSAAGILGPVVVNYMREYQIDHGIPREPASYNLTMYILVGLLVIGLLANLASASGRRQALHDRRRTGRREEAGAREGRRRRSGQRPGRRPTPRRPRWSRWPGWPWASRWPGASIARC